MGGGLFGVVVDGNWTVCEQIPGPGTSEAESVTLVVERSCGGTDEAPPADSPESDPSEAPLTESPGATTFLMPDLIGVNLQEAQDSLQALGSYLLDQEDASGLDRFQILDSNWVVCAQTPRPGASVSVDEFVTLSSVKVGEACP